jgi:hypothetical protein
MHWGLLKANQEYSFSVRDLTKDVFVFYIRKIECCNYLKTLLKELRHRPGSATPLPLIQNGTTEVPLTPTTDLPQHSFRHQAFILPFEFLQAKIFESNLEQILLFFKTNLFASDFNNYCLLFGHSRHLFQSQLDICRCLERILTRGKRNGKPGKGLGGKVAKQRQVLEELLEACAD